MNLGWKPAISMDFRCINLPQNQTADEQERVSQTSGSSEAIKSLVRTTKLHTKLQINLFQMEKENA